MFEKFSFHLIDSVFVVIRVIIQKGIIAKARKCHRILSLAFYRRDNK